MSDEEYAEFIRQDRAIQEEALKSLTHEYVKLGLADDDVRRLWWITAGAFNQLNETKKDAIFKAMLGMAQYAMEQEK